MCSRNNWKNEFPTGKIHVVRLAPSSRNSNSNSWGKFWHGRKHSWWREMFGWSHIEFKCFALMTFFNMVSVAVHVSSWTRASWKNYFPTEEMGQSKEQSVRGGLLKSVCHLVMGLLGTAVDTVAVNYCKVVNDNSSSLFCNLWFHAFPSWWRCKHFKLALLFNCSQPYAPYVQTHHSCLQTCTLIIWDAVQDKYILFCLETFFFFYLRNICPVWPQPSVVKEKKIFESSVGRFLWCSMITLHVSSDIAMLVALWGCT